VRGSGWAGSEGLNEWERKAVELSEERANSAMASAHEVEDSAPFQADYSPEKGRVCSSAPQRPQVVTWRTA